MSKLPQLVSQTSSKAVKNPQPSILQPLEQGISESLGRIKGAIMELAGGIQDRINSYYQACNAVSQHGLKERISDCRKSLDEVEKTRAVRELLKHKIDLVTKEIATIEKKSKESKTPEKDTKKTEHLLAEAKKKREKDWKAKFDIATTDLNSSLVKFTVKIKECLSLTRQYEGARNGVVVVGFDKLSNIFADWALKTSKIQFTSILDKLRSFSLVDRALEGIPTSWTLRPTLDVGFDELVQKFDSERNQQSHSGVLEIELKERLAELRPNLSRADQLKAELYSQHLVHPQLSESEVGMLDDEITLRLEENSFVGYLLLLLNYQLLIRGKNQMKVSQKLFISLKSKFLTVLSSKIYFSQSSRQVN